MRNIILFILFSAPSLAIGLSNKNDKLVLVDVNSEDIKNHLSNEKRRDYRDLIIYNLQGNTLNLTLDSQQSFEKITVINGDDLKYFFIDSNAFTSIKEISLINVGLESIPKSLFYMEKIEAINLSRNRIKKIIVENNSFWKKIKQLDLSFNLGLEIRAEGMALRNLNSLKLAGCGMNIPPPFLPNIDSLYHLDLSYNFIESLGISNNLASLQYLNLSSNCIKEIAMEKGITTPNLVYINISVNKLDHLPNFIYTTRWLNYLNISYNKIETLILRDDPSLRRIVYFDLSYNNLENLLMGSLFYNSKTTVNLCGNSLSKTDDSWIMNLSNSYSGAIFILDNYNLANLFYRYEKKDYIVYIDD